MLTTSTREFLISLNQKIFLVIERFNDTEMYEKEDVSRGRLFKNTEMYEKENFSRDQDLRKPEGKKILSRDQLF